MRLHKTEETQKHRGYIHKLAEDDWSHAGETHKGREGKTITMEGTNTNKEV